MLSMPSLVRKAGTNFVHALDFASRLSFCYVDSLLAWAKLLSLQSTSPGSLGKSADKKEKGKGKAATTSSHLEMAYRPGNANYRIQKVLLFYGVMELRQSSIGNGRFHATGAILEAPSVQQRNVDRKSDTWPLVSMCRVI